MLREYFCVRNERCVFAGAWGGLLLVLGHAAVHGWVKFALNEWYRGFYDHLGSAAALVGNATTTPEDWAQKRSDVASGLWDFVKIAAVAVVVMPAAKLIRSLWALHWRLALTRAYLRAWDPNRAPIEGSAQRVQEDAQRFARGTELIITIGLDCILTLVIFVPVLNRLGEETPCPDVARGFSVLGGGWLVGLAVFVALVGFGVTLLVGHKLVGLEVANQVVEAKLRTDLVLLETSPDRICETVHSVPHPDPPDPLETVDADRMSPYRLPTFAPPLPLFKGVVEAVRHNYTSLFFNFTALNLWLALYEQFATILPYTLFAPLLFSADPSTRVSMGVLIQVSNSFDKVFGSLNIIADSWVSVNEYRSVLRRLAQFEANLYQGIPYPSRRQPRSPPFGVLSEVSLSHLPDVRDDESGSSTRV